MRTIDSLEIHSSYFGSVDSLRRVEHAVSPRVVGIL